MGEQMEFPATFDEFAEQYKIVDKKEVYTNGTALIPIFRVKQWLEHAVVAPKSETAREIFKDLWEMVIPEKCTDGCAFYLDMAELTALEEKYCGKDTNVPAKKTNFDRIKAMTVDEMAKFIPDWSYTGACKCGEKSYVDCNNECENCVKDWLESEVNEDVKD